MNNNHIHIEKRIRTLEKALGVSVDSIRDFYENSYKKGTKYEDLYANPIAEACGYLDPETFLKGYHEELRAHLWGLCGEALEQAAARRGEEKVDHAMLSGELTPDKLRCQIAECFKIGVGMHYMRKRIEALNLSSEEFEALLAGEHFGVRAKSERGQEHKAGQD